MSFSAVYINDEDIKWSIRKLPNSNLVVPDGIPANLLKKCELGLDDPSSTVTQCHILFFL